MSAPVARLARGLFLALALVSILAPVASWWQEGRTGLAFRLYPSTEFHGTPLLERETAAIDLKPLLQEAGRPGSDFSARWTGVWIVAQDGSYDLHGRACGAFRVLLDGRALLEIDTRRLRRGRASVVVAAGVHPLEVEFVTRGPGAFAKLLWSFAGEEPGRFDPGVLYPSPPDASTLRLHGWVRTLRRATRLAWASVALLALGTLLLGLGASFFWRLRRGTRFLERVREVWPGQGTEKTLDALRRIGRPAMALVPALIVLYSGALRFQALVDQYWPDAPPWAYQILEPVRSLHPRSYAWEPVESPYVGGDPYQYLLSAREARRFYDAYVREPVFVFATRIALSLAGQQDVGISFTSAAFSTLMVLATYLLGARLLGRGVGAIAATALAIDAHAIVLSGEGWRDDAFAFFVTLSAYAFLRLHDEASFVNAILAGFVGAAACLTRITSLSFVLPAIVVSAFTARAPSRRARFASVALCALITAALVAPYLVNCAVAFGDPFYAINYHTRFYRDRAQLPAAEPMGWAEYLLRAGPPGETLETMLGGLTIYPFANKWRHFDLWLPGLSFILSRSAVLGLALLALDRRGRALLLVLFASLLPFAFTWKVRGGSEWRFTLHAYPFYLVAAGCALTRLAAFFHPDRLREARGLVLGGGARPS